MNPTDQENQDMTLEGNFDSNPFAGVLSQIQSQGQPMGGMMGGGGQPPQAPPAMPQMMGGQKPPPNQLVPGEEGGNSQFLVATMQQLQRYITAEDDSNNIMIARSIIGLITKLLDKEQKQQTAKLPQDQAALEAMQPPTGAEAPGGPSEVAPQA